MVRSFLARIVLVLIFFVSLRFRVRSLEAKSKQFSLSIFFSLYRSKADQKEYVHFDDEDGIHGSHGSDDDDSDKAVYQLSDCWAIYHNYMK